jgi:hypothetical protein
MRFNVNLNARHFKYGSRSRHGMPGDRFKFWTSREALTHPVLVNEEEDEKTNADHSVLESSSSSS